MRYISSKTIFLLGTPFLFISLVYAVGLFSSLPFSPPGRITNGSFSTRFTTMFNNNCPANHFLKGFKSDYTPICVGSDGIYSGPVITSSVYSQGTYPTNPSGQLSGGKFGTYFRNLVGTCPGNTIVKGFASDGWKYCVDLVTPTIITNPHTLIALPNVTPATPSGQSVGGKFQDFFTAMSITCTGSQVVNGFDINGNPSCIDGIINCAGYWKDTSICNTTCGPGTKQQTYSITTPEANGGSPCLYADGTTRNTSCSLAVCPATCSDGIKNQGETYVDCGGPNCGVCMLVYCGTASSHGQYSTPTDPELCVNGIATPVTNYLNGTYWEYRWTCNGLGGPVNCRGARNIDGVCGTAHLTPTSTIPLSNLCTVGNASTPVYGAPPYYAQWHWYCYANGGVNGDSPTVGHGNVGQCWTN